MTLFLPVEVNALCMTILLCGVSMNISLLNFGVGSFSVILTAEAFLAI